MTLKELYRELQNYRDATYQEALWKILAFSPINPTAIRLIEACIKNIPYEPQKVTIDGLNMIIDLNPQEVGIFLIKEAANAAVQLNILESRDYLFSQLEKSDLWKLNHEETPALAQTLVGAIAQLDKKILGFKERMLSLIVELGNNQVKAEVVDYFIKNKIEDDEGVLGKFFSDNEGVELPPTNHGTRFSNQGVSLLRQSLPLSIDVLKTRYQSAVDKNEP